MRFIKQTACSNCRKTGIVYESNEEGFVFHCFSCGRREKQCDPLLYKDSVKMAFLTILKKLHPETVKKIPPTATWRDLHVTVLGLLDVQELENARFRKFFKENSGQDSLQLSFYHLLKEL